ncbi:tetratricopeptide repeat protein [Planctomycetota bacterium]
MSALLEVFGKGVTIHTADLLVHGLDHVRQDSRVNESWPFLLRDIVDCLVGQRLESAEEKLRLLLFDDRRSVWGYLAAAALSLHQNRLDQAVEDLGHVYRRQPGNTLALYALGYCHEQLGQDEQAVQFYQDCLKFKNHLELPSQRLAAIYLKNGRYDKVIEQYHLLKTAYPENLSLMLVLGHAYVATGQYAQAVDTFSKAILMHPDSLSFDDYDLNRLIQDNDFDGALAHIDGMIDLYPGKVDLLVKRGDVLQLLGATEDALTEYRQALDLCPDFMDAAIKLGSLHLRNGAFSEACKLFNHALEVHDMIVDAYLGLATAHDRANEKTCALAALSSAAMIQPNSTLLFFETARTLLMSLSNPEGFLMEEPMDPQEAATAIVHAHQSQITAHPNNPSLHYRLGLLNLYVNGPATAIPVLAAAVQQGGLYPRAQAKLAVCYQALGDSEQALKQLTAHSTVSLETLQLHYAVARLYWQPVKFAASTLNLSRMLEANWTDVDPATHIAVILENMGILDRAEQMLANLSETLDSVMTHRGDDPW